MKCTEGPRPSAAYFLKGEVCKDWVLLYLNYFKQDDFTINKVYCFTGKLLCVCLCKDSIDWFEDIISASNVLQYNEIWPKLYFSLPGVNWRIVCGWKMTVNDKVLGSQMVRTPQTKQINNIYGKTDSRYCCDEWDWCTKRNVILLFGADTEDLKGQVKNFFYYCQILLNTFCVLYVVMKLNWENVTNQSKMKITAITSNSICGS